MDKKDWKPDIIFFDDGTSYIRRKVGIIKKIEDGFVFFSENGNIQLIPVNRIVRVEKGGD